MKKWQEIFSYTKKVEEKEKKRKQKEEKVSKIKEVQGLSEEDEIKIYIDKEIK